MLQFNFKIAHIAGSVNNAADFPLRLELKVTEKIRLKIREGIPTTRIEVTTTSSDVADEEQFFFTQATTTASQKNKLLNGKNNLKEMQSNGQQMKDLLP